MNEVRVVYNRTDSGTWSATVSGAFSDRCEGATQAEMRRKVAAALASQGATYPTAHDRGATPGGSETVVYA